MRYGYGMAENLLCVFISHFFAGTFKFDFLKILLVPSLNVSFGWVTSWRKRNNSFLSLFDHPPFSPANPLYQRDFYIKDFGKCR